MYAVISLAVLVGGCFVAGQIMIRIPRTHITKHPMTLSEFVQEFGVTNLPSSASNIYYAGSTVAMDFAGAKLYRFDAPLEDCIAHACLLIEYNNKNEGPERTFAKDLIKINSKPDPIQLEMMKAYGLKNLNWFDVENITNGLTVGRPPSNLPMFWIDEDRNRFYYHWTD